MKLSIFTPTHKLKNIEGYLERLYASIKTQTYSNWEWVIVPNNGGTVSLPADDRIKIFQTDDSTNIGYLKRFACSKCTGEILMEVDHDDELFSTAVEECIKVFDDQDIDFAYSNSVEVTDDWTPRVFDKVWGWETRPCTYKGHELVEMIQFPPDPRSLSKIWFCPNHFRAWRTSFYNEIGGHNPEMKILDDQDILCRTYIAGKMKHIDKPLYVYHIHKDNTCYGELNGQIQEETLLLHDKYIEPMALKWATTHKLRKLDLCGGHNKPLGFESVDILNGDITADLEKPWPFKDGNVGVIRASDALEHLHDPIHAMKEAYRVLAPNGWFLTNTPSTDGRGAFQDPTHVSFWNSNSFWYYCKHDQARFINTPVKFQLSRVKNYFPSEWHEQHNILYVKADLVKFQGRTPGAIEI